MIDFDIAIMTPNLVPSVLVIEQESHSHPWSVKNFEDSITSGYWTYVFKEKKSSNEALIGHMVFMPGVDELHLLNITVSQAYRREHVAWRAMKAIEPLAIERDLTKIFLEVRMSNDAAIALYKDLGYENLAIRKDYYPAENGRREDALIMSKNLIPS